MVDKTKGEKLLAMSVEELFQEADAQFRRAQPAMQTLYEALIDDIGPVGVFEVVVEKTMESFRDAYPGIKADFGSEAGVRFLALCFLTGFMHVNDCYTWLQLQESGADTAKGRSDLMSGLFDRFTASDPDEYGAN